MTTIHTDMSPEEINAELARLGLPERLHGESELRALLHMPLAFADAMPAEALALLAPIARTRYGRYHEALVELRTAGLLTDPAADRAVRQLAGRIFDAMRSAAVRRVIDRREEIGEAV